MANLNKKGVKTAKPSALSPIRTTAQDKLTFEGAAAWSRNATSDLFLLAVTNFYDEDTFYEEANARNKRFVELVHRVAREEPDWVLGFLPWLRKKAFIRTASVVGAVEAARVLAQPNQPGFEVGPARRIIRETLYRPDEAGEAMIYWLANYGKRMPNPIRRGIRDVVERSFSERNFLKWDSDRKPVRMADVVELTHPRPSGDGDFLQNQSDLFKYMIDDRHRPTDAPGSLNKIRYQKHVLSDLHSTDRANILTSDGISAHLAEAGITWEALSSTGPMNQEAWEAMIPNLGYSALLKNLRNFSEAGISNDMKRLVVSRLADAEEVARSRELPFRFLSAYLYATDPTWVLPLEQGLQHSLQNLPELTGSTLVLVDTSDSMNAQLSQKGKITRMMAGALFGIALAAKGQRVDLYGFADGTFRHNIRRGAGVLRTVEQFIARSGEVGHGTKISTSLRTTWNGQHRVVIVTDCQTFGTGRGSYWVNHDVGNQIPSSVPIYAFNTTGYAPAMMETSKTRHEFGGLTDHTFKMIPLIELGQQAKWPWED